MIRSILLVLTIVSQYSQALTPAEAVQAYPRASQLERAEAAYTLCEQAFSQWPAEGYQQQIRELGALWGESPEAAYYSLSLCQSMWQKKFLQPVRAVEIQNKQQQVRLALYLAMADVINVYKHLREEIRLHVTAMPPAGAGIPPAPYEILSGMAASERQLDAVVMHQMREAGSTMAAGLVGIGGTTVSLLRGATAVANFTTVTSSTVGTVAKHALLITALSVAAGGAADYGIWRMQHSRLKTQVYNILRAMENPRAPTGVYLEQLSKAIEQLGYLYNIELYMRDSGSSTPSQIVTKRCLPDLQTALDDPRKLMQPFLTQSLCQDASTLWLAVSQYLSMKYPQQAEARAMAARLEARVRRILLSQADIDAYWAAQPICREIMHPGFLFQRVYECTDTSGRIII